MKEQLLELLEPAFREVPGSEANQAIARARRERAGSDPDDETAPAVRSYELVLSTWERFVRDQLPKLVYHLESVGARLPRCRGVMISAFLGERLFLVDAEALVERVCKILGVTPEQLVARHGLGESSTAKREPLLLPGPKGSN
jgi:hypothetical protein